MNVAGDAGRLAERHELQVEGRCIRVDEGGYLLDRCEWDPSLAAAMARLDGLTLGPAHWQVLHLIAAYFDEHGRSPPMRVLVSEVARVLGTRSDSRALYRLFPQGPAKQAARYAGLPRPASCI